MSLQSTPSSERLHIGFFGRRNAGKSSLVNAVTGQQLAVVSDVKGTTTDPVSKAMELLPLGPVVIIDTPGFDDEGALGTLRVQKTKEILRRVDVAVLVADATVGLTDTDRDLLTLFAAREIPALIAYNKTDLPHPTVTDGLSVSAKNGTGVEALKNAIGQLAGEREQKPIVRDLLQSGDLAVLVTPIDSAAPKGRLILPQQQTLRDLLDGGCLATVTRETELPAALAALAAPPAIVITDSQAFGVVSQIVPPSVPLTSFSILMARYKGNLPAAVEGAAMLDKLQDGDKVLIAEGCTHHRQCGDIGSVKLPAWINKYTGKQIDFAFCSGNEFPEDLSPYRLVLHCGGCMQTEREMRSRARIATDSGVPMTNYGVAIAQLHGILRRSLSPFPELLKLLNT